MKRVYIVDHPVGYGRSSRKVIEQKTARVRYQDSLAFKRQCRKLINDLEPEMGINVAFALKEVL